MNETMILLSGESVSVTLIRNIGPSDLTIGLYHLPGGRTVVGYHALGKLFQDTITPEEFGWNED